MPTTDLLLELTHRYSEAHRRYHDLRHIANMLHHGIGLGLSDEQIMAIWFHDAVYEALSKTNEIDSAALAVERLTAAGWQASRIAVVKQIVLDTEGHVPSIPESDKVLDLDLATLGGTWQQYNAIGERIREEFKHVSEADWQAGRGQWLTKMLAKDQIFWTDWGKPRELEARRNMTREFENLNG